MPLITNFAHIAQLVEHFHGKEKVACSTQAVGTKIYLKFYFTKYVCKTLSIIARITPIETSSKGLA